MDIQITTGAAQLFLGSILPGLGLIRWAKTPHRVSHELMEKRVAAIYDYFIPQAIKERESRDTPGQLK